MASKAYCVGRTFFSASRLTSINRHRPVSSTFSRLKGQSYQSHKSHGIDLNKVDTQLYNIVDGPRSYNTSKDFGRPIPLAIAKWPPPPTSAAA